MTDLLNNNKVTLKGVVVTKPEFSHEICGEKFYEFTLNVPRLSDSSDNIPITISERLMQEENIELKSDVALIGQFRSYNKELDGKSRLMLTVFVRELLPYELDINPNTIEITGYLCKEPIYRTTPFKREICDMLLAVNRAYNKSDYLPCIAWGRNARFVKGLNIGQKISVFGRIQSRQYQKVVDGQEISKTAYEISVGKIMLVEKNEEIYSDAKTENIAQA